MTSGLYIGIGGNLGDREAHLQKATGELKNRVGRLLKKSSVYETSSWGNTDQPDFLNQVLKFSSSLSPEEVLRVCLNIEKEMGRVRKNKWENRLIDIDILFYAGRTIHQHDLLIPHPYIQDRKFMLVPLHEISPGLIHPVLKKRIHSLLEDCKDPLPVKKYSGKK